MPKYFRFICLLAYLLAFPIYSVDFSSDNLTNKQKKSYDTLVSQWNVEWNNKIINASSFEEMKKYETEKVVFESHLQNLVNTQVRVNLARSDPAAFKQATIELSNQ